MLISVCFNKILNTDLCYKQNTLKHDQTSTLTSKVIKVRHIKLELSTNKTHKLELSNNKTQQ